MRFRPMFRTVLVTAFQPFGGRATNASLLAMRVLRNDHAWLRTRILPVDSHLGPLRLRRALREVKPDALVMLGEAGGSREIRLETMAWNELDFRIPDAAGRQPVKSPIHLDGPGFLASTLPFATLRTSLADDGFPVVCSEDAGRYLCNQILFDALHHIEARSLGCMAGFVHLPLESELPTSRAAAALARLVTILRET